MLDHIDDPLSTVDSSLFQFSLFDGWNIRNDSVSVLRVERNVLKAVIHSDVSHLFSAHFHFKDNLIDIGHMRTTDINNYGFPGRRYNHTLFNTRTALKKATMEIERNQIRIGSMDSSVVRFMYNINDDKDYEHVIYRDNIFITDGVVSLDYPRSKRLLSSNTMAGKGSITFTQAPTARKNRSIEQLEATQQISRYTDNAGGITFLKNFGTSTIQVDTNLSETVNLLRITFNDLYHYNDHDELPVLVTIRLHTRTANRRAGHFEYKLVFADYRSMYYADPERAVLARAIPYWSDGGQPFDRDIAPVSSSAGYGARLALVSHLPTGSSHREGYLILKNMGSVESFEASVSIEKYEFAEGMSREDAIWQTMVGIDK